MCTAGSLVIDYAEGRTTRARYTFSTTEDPRVRRCRPDGWEFILENDVARVYSVLESGEPAYYVCRFETGRVRWFGRDHTGDTAYDPNESVDVAGTRLADRKLAYVLIETDSRYEPRQHHRLVVRDFVSWEIEHEIEGGHHWRGGVDFGAPGDEYGITDVELEDDGAVGWIVAKGPEGGYRPFEVRKADATGSDVLLDSGTDIDPESLTLEGSTLRWLHAGEPRSASLD